MSEKGGLGSYLREIRERQGLTLEEIAAETKINCRFLRAIEEEAWEELPAEVYLIGYLRAYAEAVGLDPGEVLARYREVRPRDEVPVLEEPPETSSPRPSSRAMAWGIILIIAMAILVYLLLVR